MQGDVYKRQGQARELVDEGGSDEGVDAVAAVEALNELVDLALVGDGLSLIHI